jgi:hypothetical protein
MREREGEVLVLMHPSGGGGLCPRNMDGNMMLSGSLPMVGLICDEMSGVSGCKSTLSESDARPSVVNLHIQLDGTASSSATLDAT